VHSFKWVVIILRSSCENALVLRLGLLQFFQRFFVEFALHFNNASKAKALMVDYEKVNDPKCTEEDCAEACERLAKASDEIRSKADIAKKVAADVKQATSSGAFRKWEQVNEVYLTLEPFAMANGLLTQSYKVKRDFVAKRYQDELP